MKDIYWTQILRLVFLCNTQLCGSFFSKNCVYMFVALETASIERVNIKMSQ